MSATERRIDTPARADWSPTGRGARSRPCCSATARGRHRHRRPRGARPRPARNGVTVVRFEQPWRVAGRKVATPPRRWTPASRPPRTSCADAPAGHRRPVGGRPLRRPLRPAARRDRLPGARVPAPPAGQAERSRLGELEGAGSRPWWCRASATRWAARGVPDDLDLAVVPGADHSFRCRGPARCRRREALGIIVESTLEWVIREVAGNGRST